jgi:hypothetical protein
MFPDLSKLNDLIAKVPVYEKMLENSVGWLKCVHDQQERTNRMLERAHGSTNGLDFQKYPPRGLSRLPEIFEGTATDRQTIKFVTDGYTPSDGFYANLGENPMRVTLIGVNDQGTPHTVPSGASIAVRSLLTGALIEPVTPGETVSYQFYLF